MSELVYTRQQDNMHEEAAMLARMLGMHRALTDTTLHFAEGQR